MQSRQARQRTSSPCKGEDKGEGSLREISVENRTRCTNPHPSLPPCRGKEQRTHFPLCNRGRRGSALPPPARGRIKVGVLSASSALRTGLAAPTPIPAFPLAEGRSSGHTSPYAIAAGAAAHFLPLQGGG